MTAAGHFPDHRMLFNQVRVSLIMAAQHLEHERSGRIFLDGPRYTDLLADSVLVRSSWSSDDQKVSSPFDRVGVGLG